MRRDFDAHLKSRGLEKNAEAILSGHPATDDPALFNKLHRLASADPVKFAQTSLVAQCGPEFLRRIKTPHPNRHCA